MSIMGSPRVHEEGRADAAPKGVADGHNFRLAMRELASGVSVITCGEGDARNGCTATSVVSLSLSPPTLLVCLNLQTSTLATLRRTGSFCVNLLAAEHRPIAERFAGVGGFQGKNRFGIGDWAPLITGSPALLDGLAVFDCRVEEILERHTHAILIGSVEAVRVPGADEALVHWRSRFETL
jgi:flavin reductase (DIM6/NTAB) family NADH-FMN oxidoreductase RutF